MKDAEANIEDRVKNVIMKTLRINLDANEIKRDTSLMGKGLGLDSVGVMELVVGLEQEFDLYFEDSDLSGELFGSIGSLTNYISEKLENKHA